MMLKGWTGCSCFWKTSFDGIMLVSRGRARTCCLSWQLNTMPASWSISRAARALISLHEPMAMSRWDGCFRLRVFQVGLSWVNEEHWSARAALYMIRETRRKHLRFWAILRVRSTGNNLLRFSVKQKKYVLVFGLLGMSGRCYSFSCLCQIVLGKDSFFGLVFCYFVDVEVLP